MKRFNLTGFFGISIFVWLTLAAPTSATAPVVQDFGQLDDNGASEAANAIVSDQRDLEKLLVNQLQSPQMPAKRQVYLIYVLGRLRSPMAVDPLIRIIDFPAPFLDPKLSSGRWESYPAAEALMNIGDQSVKRILQVLAKEVVPLRSRLMVSVVLRVEGAPAGRVLMETAISSAGEESEREHLRSALKEFDDMASKNTQ